MATQPADIVVARFRKRAPKQYGVAYSNHTGRWFIFVKINSYQYAKLSWECKGFDTLEKAKAASPLPPITLPYSYLNPRR